MLLMFINSINKKTLYENRFFLHSTVTWFLLNQTDLNGKNVVITTSGHRGTRKMLFVQNTLSDILFVIG